VVALVSGGCYCCGCGSNGSGGSDGGDGGCCVVADKMCFLVLCTRVIRTHVYIYARTHAQTQTHTHTHCSADRCGVFANTRSTHIPRHARTTRTRGD